MEYALVVRWLAAYLALAAAGLPVAARLFPRFEGRGAGFAVPIALAVLAIPTYWVGLVAFGPPALAAGVLTLAVAAAASALDPAALRERRVELGADVDREAAVETLVVFAAGFLFVVALRAVDPAVHPLGGEKFLDFGLLKSLSRATALPPEDVWFAGEPVKYYYGGHLIAALLAKLTATPPRFAYNLALAGFYGALVAAAFELAGAVGVRRGVPRRPAGLAAAFFVGFAGNLVPAARVAVAAAPNGVRRPLAELLAAHTRLTVRTLLGDLGEFSYWTASRVVPGTINEFPLFAWLNGDLHAHMMGTPFLLLAAALAYGYYLTPAARRTRRLALAFVAVPLLASLQAVVDTWSFPSMFGLLWLAATFAPASPASLLPPAVRARLEREGAVATDGAGAEAGLAAEAARVGSALVVAGVAAALALLLASPFLLGSAAGGNREVAILGAAQRSGVVALTLVHGAFVLAFGAYLLSRLRVERPLAVVVALASVVAVAAAQNLWILLVAGPLLAFGWVALRMGRPVGFETVLILAGAGLVALVEFVYVTEQAGPLRMNTVFKVYMQVWVLWGTAAGVAVPAFVRGPSTVATDEGDDVATSRRGRLSRRVGPRLANLRGAGRTLAALGVGLLVLSTSLYGAFALAGHFEIGSPTASAAGPTLDATAFVEVRHPEQAAAVRWVDGLEGQPTLLSAPGTAVYPGSGTDPRDRVMYSWAANPAASLTGVPTVAGWAHEVGYRGSEDYWVRVRDVDAMYTAPSEERAALLRAYDVEYVWVGPAERSRYGEVSFEGVRGVEPVEGFPKGTVTVYRVNQSALGAD